MSSVRMSSSSSSRGDAREVRRRDPPPDAAAATAAAPSSRCSFSRCRALRLFEDTNRENRPPPPLFRRSSLLRSSSAMIASSSAFPVSPSNGSRARATLARDIRSELAPLPLPPPPPPVFFPLARLNRPATIATLAAARNLSNGRFDPNTSSVFAAASSAWSTLTGTATPAVMVCFRASTTFVFTSENVASSAPSSPSSCSSSSRFFLFNARRNFAASSAFPSSSLLHSSSSPYIWSVSLSHFRIASASLAKTRLFLLLILSTSMSAPLTRASFFFSPSGPYIASFCSRSLSSLATRSSSVS